MQDEYEHINFWKAGESEYPEQMVNMFLGKPECKPIFGGIKHYTVSATNTPTKDIDSALLLGDAVTEPGDSVLIGNILYVKP